MSALNINPNELGTKLSILLDVLNKKKFALACILGICENLEEIFLSELGQGSEFLPEMGQEKQNLIEQVLEMDDVFQNVFDGIVADFQANHANHKEKVTALQEAINEVLELDIKIRAKETHLRERMLQGSAANLKKQASVTATHTNKSYILEQYKNSSKK